MSRIADAWRLRKRDGVWYVHGTEAGRYFRRSTKKTDQREALAVLKEWQKDPERAARPSGDVTFADMEAALWRHYRIADRRSVKRPRTTSAPGPASATLTRGCRKGSRTPRCGTK
jgi:hypothetical protein